MKAKYYDSIKQIVRKPPKYVNKMRFELFSCLNDHDLTLKIFWRSNVFLFGGHNNAVSIGKDQCYNHNNLYINILTYKKKYAFWAVFLFLWTWPLRIGDIRTGKNFHIWTKSNIMLTNIDKVIEDIYKL